MSTPAVTDPPFMLRAAITREEFATLKAQAVIQGVSVQDLLAQLIREWIGKRDAT